MKFAVVGGINLDVTGVITGETRPGDSNPGRISLSPGGVGRNIAAALMEHGQEVLFVTADSYETVSGSKDEVAEGILERAAKLL